LVESLAGRAQTIAKGWLLLLLERAPLAEAGAIPAAALAAEGPALCAAFVRALASEGELERLRPGGELAPALGRIGTLAGAADASATAAAVDALRACVWDAALEAKVDPRDPAAVRELAERLAEVTAVVTATAVGTGAAEPPAFRQPAEFDPPSPPSEPRAGDPGADHVEDAAGPVLHDLREGGSVSELPARTAPAAGDETAPAMDDDDLWTATLERHVDRCQREGGGLALLRVELVDGERIAASAPEGQAGVPYGRLAQAIRRAIRRQDLVASDHQGRAWVIAPGVGRAGAIALAERIGAGVERGEEWRGGPLAATIGFAVYGEDGRDGQTLIERAEEAMLAATAAGVRIGEAIPSPDDDPAGGPRLVR
jgi:diguanylate cyclase with GGDEF domain